MTKPIFRSISTPLEVDDAALGRIADKMGVPTLVKPSPPLPSDGSQVHQDSSKPAGRSDPAPKEQSPPRVKKTAPASITTRTALEKLTFELPGYLIDAIKRDAIDRHTTARHVLMLALQTAGFKIDAADLVPDARRMRRKTANP
jgi:hypothetical protein